jgi:mono/diheme cytochrome c family protein
MKTWSVQLLSLLVGLLLVSSVSHADVDAVSLTAAAPIPVEASPEVLEKGRYLFEASGCMHCHTNDKTKPLAGGKGIPTPFGVFIAPNITMDKSTGIGNWTDAQFLKAMRKGKNPAGQNYFPVFPFTSYSQMTDADILSIKAFLKTLPSFELKNKEHQVRFPYNLRSLVSVWRFFNISNQKNRTEADFFKNRGPFTTIPTRDQEWNRGAYLTEAVLHCAQCHTPRNGIGSFKWKEWMGGSRVSGGKTAAPNITSSKNFGRGHWSSEDWEMFLTTGMNPDGVMVGGEMAQVVDFGTAKLTAQDRQAVIKYLISLKPVESKP